MAQQSMLQGALRFPRNGLCSDDTFSQDVRSCGECKLQPFYMVHFTAFSTRCILFPLTIPFSDLAELWNALQFPVVACLHPCLKSVIGPDSVQVDYLTSAHLAKVQFSVSDRCVVVLIS